jgi:hypothetical protein
MPNPIIPILLFNNVPQALAPLSANTNYETIVTGYLPGTGDTVGSIVTFDTPHPIYSNGENKEIIQMNAVTIGGFNGLNS